MFVSAFVCLNKASTQLRSKVLWSPGIVYAVVACMISIGIYSMIPPARQEMKSISRIGIWWMVAFCVLLYFGNLIFFSALVEAPNPGLARAILSLEIIGTAVLGVILSSKAALTTRQIAGIFTIILGTVGVVYE